MAIMNVPITTDFSAQNLLNIDTINMSGSGGLCCINQPEAEFPLPLDRVIPRVEFAVFQGQ